MILNSFSVRSGKKLSAVHVLCTMILFLRIISPE